MTEPRVFPGQTTIIASTSDYFPLDSLIEVKPSQTEPTRVQLIVKRQGKEPEPLFEAELPKITLPEADKSLRGRFENLTSHRMLDGIVTLCPGKASRVYLVGRVTAAEGRIEGGGTGVWVAEEPPKEKEPPVRYT